MAEEAGRDEWNRTAALMALVANIMRDPKKGKPAKPEDFTPSAVKIKKPVPKVPLTVLRDVFVKK